MTFMQSSLARTVVAAALMTFAACGGGSDKPADALPDSFDRTALLTHIATNVYLPLHADFEAKAALVAPRIAAYCDALDAGTVGDTQTAARTAWADAIDSWERIDAVLVGPAAMDNKALRDRIYAWPLLSPCGLDRDTASRWADPASYSITTKLANVRSLLSVEYLLYTTETMHGCATTPTGWDALGADLPRARCRLAEVIAADVHAAAAQLHMAWRPDGGDYAGVLARAGRGSSIRTAHEGVNQISDGFFYADRLVKDMKLGEPAGITANVCGTVQTPCDREVELRYADRATFAIRANLDGLRRVFTGSGGATEGPGFDDFLSALGSTDVADRMTASIDTAIANAKAIPDSFLGALTSSYPAIVTTHTSVKVITDDLKSQFLTVLALEIPDDVAADND
jgi:predicted lipoprotein